VQKRTLARRALVTTALCAALVGTSTGAAEAKPRECGPLQARFDRIMAFTEANWETMGQHQWDVLRTALGSTSDQMDALGC